MFATTRRVALGLLAMGCAGALWASAPARAADPIKVGFSMALTGAVAPNGKQNLLALEIWRDDVNAKGGLLGRPVELVYYDDQTSPAQVPAIYTKLIDVDKVDLLLGPYATNMIAAAIPVIAQRKLTTIGMLGLAVNKQFNYKGYFSMLTYGANPAHEFSRGIFELAKAHKAELTTVAIVGADAEFGKTSTDGARENALAAGFKIVYDNRYPPNMTDLSPIARAIKATNPDIVFVAAYPPDTVAFVRAANEAGLAPKIMSGTFVGMLVTPLKVMMGPLMNGYLNNAVYQMEEFLMRATPSAEAIRMTRTGEATLLDLPERIGDAALPDIRIVDLRAQVDRRGADRYFTRELEAAVEETMARGEKSMLFLNRRGYAPVLSCLDCAATIQCPNCQVSLAFHKEYDALLCHYCHVRQKPPDACPSCGGLGSRTRIDPARVVPDPSLTLRQGAVVAWGGRGTVSLAAELARAVREHDTAEAFTSRFFGSTSRTPLSPRITAHERALSLSSGRSPGVRSSTPCSTRTSLRPVSAERVPTERCSERRPVSFVAP